MMSQPDPVSGPWACVRVLRGAAPHEILLRSGDAEWFAAGSDPEARLCFPATDVAPRQFEAMWDGEHLWLQDALRLGKTFVNGTLLNEWRCLPGQCLVAFGPARLWITCAGPVSRTSAPDLAAMQRARGLESVPPEYPRERETGRITIPPELLKKR